MDLNLTLFGEVITFAILVFVTVKFIWPPLTKAMDARQKQIADGIAAAERSQKSLNLAREKIRKDLKAAKTDAVTILNQASRQAAQTLEEARKQAGVEGAKIIASAKDDITAEVILTKQNLQKYIADLVIAGTEKVLQEKLTAEIDQKLVDRIIEELKVGQ